jgi:hypothetical protein
MQYFSCWTTRPPTMTRIQNDLILANFQQSINFFSLFHFFAKNKLLSVKRKSLLIKPSLFERIRDYIM